MDTHNGWFENLRKSEDFKTLTQRPIAYFCAEFALDDRIPTYAGGLGILAGDIIREALDQALPFVGIGLYYHEGYTCKQIEKDGVVVKACLRMAPEEVGLAPVLNEKNEPLIITFPIQDRKVAARAWKWLQGSVTIYLLDTDVPQNDPLDRRITDRLYTNDKEMRFKQEILLGIGGFRLLTGLNINPQVYHLNEGHSAMMVLEMARREVEVHGGTFFDQLARAREHIVFTNHTLLIAGNDTFSNDLVSTLLGGYSQELAVPVAELVKLGLIQETSIFSMTMLALRMASRIGAVSQLHMKKAAETWKDHPMEAVTNGVHLGTWNGIAEGEDIWAQHQKNKRALLHHIKEQTGVSWGENDLVAGWARRIVAYKRPLALFQDLTRFRQIATRENRPLRIVISGQANEKDDEGLHLLETIGKITQGELKGNVVYLPNYRTALARLLTTGCDIWLNTPVVGFEASGTSGMKAALNGSLPVTTRDGWVDEVELYKIGWIVNSDNIIKDLLDILERDIIPFYYTRNASGIPEGWVENMKNARSLIVKEFSATRMLKEYIVKFYLPMLQSLRAQHEKEAHQLHE